MSGAEPAGLGGKVLASIASRVVVKLGRRATYRYRIERFIHGRVGFKYPRRAVRRWLKGIERSDLEEPVEVAGARLALALDRWLGARSAGWLELPAHGSRALDIVEALYLAVLVVEEVPHSRVIEAQWARRRNQELVAALVELGRDRSLDDADLAVWLQRRSDERRRLRLAPFGLQPHEVAGPMQMMAETALEVGAGRVRVLVGPFGSGKSELAEQWHRDRIASLAKGGHGAVPVWMNAYALARRDFAREVEDLIGASTYRQRGVELVVDGLDEVPGSIAEAIAREARVFVAGDARSSVVLTTRDGVLPASPEDVHIPEFSESEAREVVDSLAGPHATWTWTQELLTTVRRPFFALAAGTALASGVVPRGQIALLVNLVERALQRGPTSAASNDVYSTCTELALDLTRSGGRSESLSFERRQRALNTRLVVGGRDGAPARFALPIFEQWFAAQGLTDEVLAEALADAASFDRWRWVLAIGLLGASRSRGDAIMAAALQLNPGAASWLVSQVSRRYQRWAPQEAPPQVDTTQAADRLKFALRTWIGSIGDLAPQIFPVESDVAPFRLGVRMDGPRLTTAWSEPVHADDEVCPLPGNVSPWTQGDTEWFSDYSGGVAPHSVWPWIHVRDRISRLTLDVIETIGALGSDDGVWSVESRYRIARLLADERSLMHLPVDRDLVVSRAKELLHSVRTVDEAVDVGGHSFAWEALADFVEWAKASAGNLIERPLPAPDVDPARLGGTGTYHGLYSEARMADFCVEMLGKGLAAYDELVESLFGRFGWSLSTQVHGSIGALASVRFSAGGPMGPPLEYVYVPRGLLEEIQEELTASVRSANGRAILVDEGHEWDSLRATASDGVVAKRVQAWLADAPNNGPFGVMGFGGAWTVVDAHHSRPASLFAAKALHRDLQRVDLSTGTFPQLNR